MAKLMTCNLCSFSTSYKSKFVTHIRIHSGLKPFACALCNYASNFRENLCRHKTTHTGQKPFACQFCLQKFSFKQNKNRHEVICKRNPKQLDQKWVQEQKTFKCNLCKYSALTSTQLKSHINSHTKENPFSCNFCKYSTTTLNNLNLHIRTHTGEKPYKCNICSYAFSSLCGLKIHKMRHAGRKPHKCSHCDYNATTAACVRLHMNNLHSKEVRLKRFSCDICSKKYFTHAHLRGHNILAHSGDQEMPYKCQYCKRGFVMGCRKNNHEAFCKDAGDNNENERLCREHGITCQVKIILSRLKIYTFKSREDTTA